MRYRQGSIELNQSRDLPLLRQILRSEFATHTQLFDFMRLNHYERSRKSFDWRLRRLARNCLVLQRAMRFCGMQPVYSIGRSGALLLQGLGEYHLLGRNGANQGSVEPGALHAIELNEIHLSALRSGLLARWIPAIEIRSQNELTRFGYAKDYDAIVTVRTDTGDKRFALEYERTPKATRAYHAIVASIAQESNVNHVLYLAPNYDLLRFVSAFFVNAKRPVYFGLVRDWHENLLDMRISHPAMTTDFRLRDVLDSVDLQAASSVQRA
ncbi:MAG: hypothetical protein L0387_31560 [Acidobacteria bacterium]|nr:hypothetical protein [Acidobacteriota bacterium]